MTERDFDPRDENALAPLWAWLASQGITESSINTIYEKSADALDLSVDKRLSDWRSVSSELPQFISTGALHCAEPGLSLPGKWSDLVAATHTLQALHPWRKGPIQLGDLFIDTEWRSDWKWSRAIPHLGDLSNLKILDIGCGNGYHCWRAMGEGASAVIGVDPTRLFHYQFRVMSELFSRYGRSELPLDIYHLPLTLEDLDETPLPIFDLVLSMGVLYHRREPLEHLRSLQSHLKPSGGRLLLETLVTPNREPLYPEGRYAQMRNVWCLPDVDTLVTWLHEAGYKASRLVDLNQTSLEEQRQTAWMRFYSLNQALNPENLDETIEGYPAPLRAMIIAEF